MLLFSHSIVSNSEIPWTAVCQASLSFTISRVCSNSCPLNLCHPTISSSITWFSSCPPSLPAWGSFPMSQLFASDGQSIEASASVSVLPMNIQGWFPLGLTGMTSLQSKGFSRVLSRTRVQKHQFFCAQPSLWSHSHSWTWLASCQKSDQVCQACEETILAEDLPIPVKPSCEPLTAQEEIWAATSWNILKPSCPPRTSLTS